jgi:serine protease inhibitor
LVDFKPSLESLGLGSLFSSDENNLNEMFASSPVNSYIKQIKQKNEVSFTIDGTKIKSLAIAGGSSAAPAKGTLEVKLNQPFIYVIRDSTNIPLYIGHFDNPAVS